MWTEARGWHYSDEECTCKLSDDTPSCKIHWGGWREFSKEQIVMMENFRSRYWNTYRCNTTRYYYYERKSLPSEHGCVSMLWQRRLTTKKFSILKGNFATSISSLNEEEGDE